MANDHWLERLSGLAYRAKGLGVCELWGVYCYLRRILEG